MSKLKTLWQSIRLNDRINWFVCGGIYFDMIPTLQELVQLQKQRIATLEQSDKAWPVLIESYKKQSVNDANALVQTHQYFKSIKEYAQNVLGDGLKYGDQELEVQHIIDICNNVLGEWDDEPEIFNHEIERESFSIGERNND